MNNVMSKSIALYECVFFIPPPNLETRHLDLIDRRTNRQVCPKGVN